MKLKTPGSADRFRSPTTLKGNAPFLGATVKQWDLAIVGNMEHTLAQIKRRAELTPKRDVNKAINFDVASYASRRLADQK
ncbi:hypothetical protein [Duganella violaceipulchra]|uniref:Uncharacterized protein n=1 Tax=Duganella violaceipulchra TaxID=2849652 RepID=A0AA41L1B3_9BURK|nr:hypothetical protein [Duganella violaceicalia]MBV6324506.1 hypothetical protein [Duganella violaceicalia]MCP2009213.1 hypothetical protein [Duganella violaceicalia]